MPGNSTILLDAQAWDLVLDAAGNIAAASEPYSLAQDAASAIKTWLGEVFFDTTIGVPYRRQVFGLDPSVALMKQLFVQAALSVPGVASARCFITAVTDREVTGQVQVTSKATGQTTAANFSAANPQAQ